MNPERAASIFRELLQAPNSELINLPRRMGLMGNPTPPDLERARELLQALMVALESGPGPNWDRIGTAWEAMRRMHGEMQREALGDAKPAWIRDVPARPSLGDPAPGTASHASLEEERQRFVPQARPAPAQHAAYQQQPAPQPQAYPPAQPQQAYAPAAQAYPSAQPPQAYPSAPSAPPTGYAPQASSPPVHPSHAATPQPHGGWGSQPGYGAPQAYTPQSQAPQPQAPPAPQPPPPPARRAPPPPPQRSAEPQTSDQGSIETSVAKYAAFCAACATQPERAFAIQVEYGIESPEGRARLDEMWQDRFDDDAGLHQQWERLFSQFRGQLR